MQYWIVVNNAFNRHWYPNIIGHIYPQDKIPSYAIVKRWS